jgi:hypothetical protein
LQNKEKQNRGKGLGRIWDVACYLAGKRKVRARGPACSAGRAGEELRHTDLG